MRYTLSNIINKPLEEVIEKFKDPEGVKHWMEGLQRIERLSGTPGEIGAKSNFHFLHKNKVMQIEETILEQNLPNQIKFAYQSTMGYNEVEMQFEKLSDNSVRQTSNNYFELKGFMKVVGFIMKGMFKKQSLKYMTGFKKYVEQSQSHSNDIKVNNAGLVLLNAYIPQLFNRLDLLKSDQFVNETQQLQAVNYLQFAVSGLSRTEEVFLLLNKVICGIQFSTPISNNIDISLEYKEIVESMLDTIISQWSAIGISSIEGFRRNWLIRDGLFIDKGEFMELTVEKRSYDILLNKYPTAFSVIKYPWMAKPLHVIWPY